jgi:hypothetical protein
MRPSLLFKKYLQENLCLKQNKVTIERSLGIPLFSILLPHQCYLRLVEAVKSRPEDVIFSILEDRSA